MLRVDDPGERAELEGLRDFYTALAERGAGRLAEIGGAVCGRVAALPNVLMVNRAIGLGVEHGPADEELEEMEAFFRDAETRYYVSVTPAARGLTEQLEARGFEAGYAWAIFRRGVDPYDACSGLRVVEARPEHAQDFSRVVTQAYEFEPRAEEALAAVVGRSGWHCFVTYDGVEPAGAAALFVHQRAGWLSFAGTLPEHRRKGSQGALFAARVARARELGVELLATETGNLVPSRPSNSYRNIVRVGFEQRYVRPNYASPLTGAAGP